jgi:D-glycero-D-manno-heptose 1,7-bisphosphate phosphatase
MYTNSVTANRTRSAVFLDRDGVINQNRSDYVRSTDQLRILPGTLPALARLAQSECAIVIITNQSAIGRELVSVKTVAQINHYLLKQIRAAGGRIDGIYLCPHAPVDACKCRKPRPGLLLQAASELQLDLHRSWFIGDSLTDLQAAAAAGVRPILVGTGLGQEASLQLISTGLGHIPFIPDLSGAVGHVLTSI